MMKPNIDEKIWEGEAVMLDVGCGVIARGVFEKGGKLAVSTRGVGSVVNGVVQKNWRMFAVDLVHMPGASDCVVQAILEAEEYLKDYNQGLYVPEYKTFRKTLENNVERSEALQKAIQAFMRK